MADTIPTDAFSRRLRELTDNPGAVRAESTVHVRDFYGNVATWHVSTFRLPGGDGTNATEESFLQRNAADGALRLHLPAEVMEAINRQRDRNVTRSRKRGARKAIETKRTNGTPIGNVAALRKARTAKRKKRVLSAEGLENIRRGQRRRRRLEARGE